MLPRPPCLRGVLVLWKHARKGFSNREINQSHLTFKVSKKQHVTTRQSGRSASQRRLRWPRSQFSWNLPLHRWMRLFQWGTQRWSPVGRRKRPHIFLQHRGEKSVRPSAIDSAWMIITASFILAFIRVNVCFLFAPLLYLCNLTASGHGTVHLASQLWLWSQGPIFQCERCLQTFSL